MVQVLGSEVEELCDFCGTKVSTLVVGVVCFVCVNCQFGARCVCVCVLEGGLVKLGLASGWPVRCQTNLTGECWIHQVK